MGLVVFAVMGLYLLIAIFVVTGAINHAKKQGKSVKRWGSGAALVMYLIPFWDLLPTLGAEKYYCATESGFFVYKTLDQWKSQNPGILPTLSMAHLVKNYQSPDEASLHARFDVRNRLMYVEYKKSDGESGVQLNERIRKAYKYDGPGLIKLSRTEYAVKDVATGEVLAREVNFRKTTKGKIWNTLNDSGWKFWFQSYESCFNDYPQHFPNGGIHKYVNGFNNDCTEKGMEEKQRDGITISCPRRR